MREAAFRRGLVCAAGGDRTNAKDVIPLEPLRVLQVVTVMNRGGLETMLMNYYRKIDRSRVQFDFMVHREEPGHYDEEIVQLGGRIWRMPAIRPGGYRPYFRALDAFFAGHPEYRIVHSHINENSSFVLRAARRSGVRCRIAHSHLSDLGLDLKLPFRLYARLAMRDHPTRYFACSRKAGEWLFGSAVPQERITVLNNAVQVSAFARNPLIRAKLRRELQAEDRLVLGHIGRFNKQKNHEFLIDVFREVHSRRPDALLLLAGDGLLRPAIERKVRHYGLAPHVRFLGVREDVPELMQAMDLFVFPSRFEGLPVVLVEAQAAGLPCIVSDAITRETDATGRLAYISLKQSPAFWAERIVASPCERAETAELLRTRGFDTASMAEWLADFYCQEA